MASRDERFTATWFRWLTRLLRFVGLVWIIGGMILVLAGLRGQVPDAGWLVGGGALVSVLGVLLLIAKAKWPGVPER